MMQELQECSCTFCMCIGMPAVMTNMEQEQQQEQHPGQQQQPEATRGTGQSPKFQSGDRQLKLHLFLYPQPRSDAAINQQQ